LVGRLDGRIFTSAAVNIPVTTEGFLRSKATTRDGVLLDFLTFTGKDLDLGDFATSCPPRPTFVSPSEFVAFGCRGDAGSLDLAGFNLRGDFLWQLNFTDEQAYPSFASAVPAGRFAFSRTVTSTHVFGNETPSLSQLQAQEVRVIQMYNGKQPLARWPLARRHPRQPLRQGRRRHPPDLHRDLQAPRALRQRPRPDQA
jgi:hypothetical protein